jgi:hypothetical protein
MQSLPSNQPLPALPLEYETTSEEQAAARRQSRRGILLLAWSYYLTVGLIATYSVLQAIWPRPSYRVVLLMDTSVHAASLLGLLGSWIILGLDWSGQRHTTAVAQTVRWFKLALLAVLVLNSLRRDFQMFVPGSSLLNMISPSLSAQCILHLFLTATSVWVLVQTWGVLRAIDGTARRFLPWSIGAATLMHLTYLVVYWLVYTHVSRRGSRVSFHREIVSVASLGLALTELILAVVLTSVARSLGSRRALTTS